MIIRVKTAGLLGKYLPPGTELNRAEIDIPSGSTPISVMERLGIPTNGPYLVTVNGTALPESERRTAILEEGDQLAIMPPLRGG
jgi:sulfur carrier protein ThiS